MIREIKLSDKIGKNELSSIKGADGCGCGNSSGNCGSLAVSIQIYQNSVNCSGYTQVLP